MSCPAVVPNAEIYLYHSFHRHYGKDANRRISMGMLRSMLKRGLLMVDELQTAPAVGALPAATIRQKRICFTALEEVNVRAHQEVFGDFSLEFDAQVLRGFGAQPAAYLTTAIRGGELLHDAGDQVLRHLGSAYEALFKLWKLGESPDKDLLAARGKVMSEIFPHAHPVETLAFAVETILNLYYPTDLPTSSPLQFFRQREWKIVPNMAYKGVWHYPPLGDQAREELLKIAPIFFMADFCGEPRVNHCSIFSEVGGRHLLHEARRLIVPDAYAAEARQVVKEEGDVIAVVPISALPQPPP
ncbi:hypothetical protein ESB00_17790 [Oleiharenicola lentus]|uniref:Uncharacterized protein n=1 Tax=Oleiharenicola lentus TaxID=2508720 RepID=A0A4Q1C5E4_9BACT|nr:hypothetical protein [Oleiharenicola lentus]RXK53543.1 hypothetical protein ESB00_17790 [Oleiharenicola lentus]